MKKTGISLTILALLSAAFIASHIIIKLEENKLTPLKQTIDDAYITVIAPPFTRAESSEQKAKENHPNNIDSIYYYHSKYKGISYTLVFGKYAREINLENGIQSIINFSVGNPP